MQKDESSRADHKHKKNLQSSYTPLCASTSQQQEQPDSSYTSLGLSTLLQCTYRLPTHTLTINDYTYTTITLNTYINLSSNYTCIHVSSHTYITYVHEDTGVQSKILCSNHSLNSPSRFFLRFNKHISLVGTVCQYHT